MSKLNEKEIIKIFQDKFGYKFIPDDVEKFKIKNFHCVVSIDTLVQSTDIPKKMKLSDAARKSIVSCISDFAAKGVKPRYAIISVTIPKKFSKNQIRELANGFNSARKEFEISILGGDTNEGKELVLSVVLFGSSKKIVSRKGSEINDVIVSSGNFGYTSAALNIILKNKKGTKLFASKAKNAFFRPSPRLKFGIMNKNYFSSSMDSSDGLSSTLHELSKQSKKKFIITKLPVNQEIVDFAKKNRIDKLNLIFNGGEEFEIIATIPQKYFLQMKKNSKKHKIPFIEIGYVAKGKGVFYKNDDKDIRIPDAGWLHFRR